MKEILIYIGLAALGAFVLYRIVKSIIENVKRERFRKKNREAQFSGSAVKEPVLGVFQETAVGAALARRLSAMAVVDEDFHSRICV